MTPNELNRGIHRAYRRCLLGGLLLAVCFVGACAHAPVVLKPNEQITVDRRNVEYPAGFDLRLAIDNLEPLTQADPLLGQIAQHLGVGVRYAHEATAVTWLELVQAVRGVLVDLECDARDRRWNYSIAGAAQ